MISAILISIGIEGAAAIAALKWALPKSNQIFYSVFAGDAFLRLAGIGGVTWWLWSRQLPFIQPLLALGFGTLAVSLIQIPFLYRAH